MIFDIPLFNSKMHTAVHLFYVQKVFLSSVIMNIHPVIKQFF